MSVSAFRPLANWLGVVLTALFVLATLMTGSIAAAMTYVYFHEPRLSPLDVSLWSWCAASIPVGGLLSWASYRLANYKRPVRRRVRPLVVDPVKRARQERWGMAFGTVGAMAVVGGVAWSRTAGEPTHRAGLAVGWAAGFYLLLHARVLWHELGHLVAGASVGVEPLSLQIGSGPVIWRWVTARGFWWEWRLWPWWGWVLAADRRARPVAWRFFVSVAGGPVADALCLPLVVYALHRGGVLDLLLPVGHGASDPALVFKLMPFWLVVVPTLNNLSPTTAIHEGQVFFSDGWYLWRTFFQPREWYQERAYAAAYTHLQRLYEAGYDAQARAEADRILARFPRRRAALSLLESQRHHQKNEPLLGAASFQRALDEGGDLEGLARPLAFAAHTAALARLGRLDEARACAEAVLARTLPPDRVAQLDALACVPFYYQDARALLPDAERWCAEALALSPEEITLRSTHAALLFEQGRVEEAVPILREVLANTHSEDDRGIASFYLALAAVRSGQKCEFTTFRAQALRWCKVPTLLARADTELYPEQ